MLGSKNVANLHTVRAQLAGGNGGYTLLFSLMSLLLVLVFVAV
jgi:hypothetical protein